MLNQGGLGEQVFRDVRQNTTSYAICTADHVKRRWAQVRERTSRLPGLYMLRSGPEHHRQAQGLADQEYDMMTHRSSTRAGCSAIPCLSDALPSTGTYPRGHA
ncbi:hypothetical protein PMIN06_008783 [Paraphaeosphaeria minitans]